MDKKLLGDMWVVGATSRIAIEMMRTWAPNGCRLVLAARNQDKLQRVAQDMSCRGAASVTCRDLSTPKENQRVSLLLVALGSMSDQKQWESSPGYRREQWEINTSVVFDWIEWGAANVELFGSGHLAVISSVASDRAKRSNYGYGASKAALDFYLAGVSHRLARLGGSVTILKPGPTETPMTTNVVGRSLADPKVVGDQLARSVEARERLAYSPHRWRWIMKAIRACPEFVWNRTNF